MQIQKMFKRDINRYINGVISVGEEFFAIHDRCPHMGSSMCTGSVSGTLLPAPAGRVNAARPPAPRSARA